MSGVWAAIAAVPAPAVATATATRRLRWCFMSVYLSEVGLVIGEHQSTWLDDEDRCVVAERAAGVSARRAGDRFGRIAPRTLCGGKRARNGALR